jgi:hypothetical protein
MKRDRPPILFRSLTSHRQDDKNSDNGKLAMEKLIEESKKQNGKTWSFIGDNGDEIMSLYDYW